MLNFFSYFVFFLYFVSFISCLTSTNLNAQDQNKRDFVPNQLIIGFKSEEAAEEGLSLIEEAFKNNQFKSKNVESTKIQIKKLNKSSAILTFDFRSKGNNILKAKKSRETIEDIAELYRQDKRVKYVHPNWIMRIRRERIKTPLYWEDISPKKNTFIPFSNSGTPNDEVFLKGLHWHYKSVPSGMSAVEAWRKTKGDKKVVVAVLDTGILFNHSDLKNSPNLLRGYDFVTQDIDQPNRDNDSHANRDNDATDTGDKCGPDPSSWHGTHVAGTIGAGVTNNGIGISGINWSVSVLPVRVLGICGGTMQDLVDAIRWSAGLSVTNVPMNKNKADIINLSLGIYGTCIQKDYGKLIEAIKDARAAGTTIVVAAGNEKLNIQDVTPGSCAGVISVASNDARGHITSYSNYGSVTLMAPGGDLKSDHDGDNVEDGVWSLVASTSNNPSGIAAYEGTSMAAPHVSGALALLLSLNPDLRGKPDEIEKLLIKSVAKLPNNACPNGCGAGILDAETLLGLQVTSSSR